MTAPALEIVKSLPCRAVTNSGQSPIFARTLLLRFRHLQFELGGYLLYFFLICANMSDFNGRFWKTGEETLRATEIHGKTINNNNRKRIIDFCINNNLIITNLLFVYLQGNS